MVSFTSLKQLVKGQLDQELSSLDTEVAECGHLAEALGTFACVFFGSVTKVANCAFTNIYRLWTSKQMMKNLYAMSCDCEFNN